MKINLFTDLFGAGWEQWQDILFIALIAFIAACLIFIIILLILKKSQDGGHIAQRVERYEKRIEAKREKLESKNAVSQAELERNRKELAEKEREAAEAEAKAAKARQEYLAKEEELKKLIENVEMSKKELAEYQKREGTHVPEDVAVNVLTDKTLAKSALQPDPQFHDCKIPLGKSLNFTGKDVADYISGKHKITYTDAMGHKPANYKIEDKTFAFVYALENDKVRVTFKCGPAYGAKLCKYLGNNVSNAKFPYGLLWFTVSNENAPCSLELIKQLIDISYKIAGLGY